MLVLYCEINYAECVFSSVYHLFLPFSSRPLSDRQISYAEQSPYFSLGDLCFDVSSCLRVM